MRGPCAAGERDDMPELPEVETVVKALDGALRGRMVEGARFFGKLRQPFDADRVGALLAGRKILSVRRRAKYILIDFDHPCALLAHLGMTGYFHLEAVAAPLEKHDRVALVLRGGDELRYADARRFGFVVPAELPEPGGFPPELAHLGPEPLGRSFTGRLMLERARCRACPVKVFIMDQGVVVGVGNIYASEALFSAGIDPRRAAGDLELDEWNRLVAEIKAVLRYAIRKGGSTIRNYRTVDGSEGGFQRTLKIYGKTGGECPACGGPVHVIRQGGRSTFFCPECQV